jgi:hypothetical protein
VSAPKGAPAGLLLRFGGALLYAVAGFVFAYRALNQLLEGRLSPFGLVAGVLGVAAVAIAAVYLKRCVEQLGDAESSSS